MKKTVSYLFLILMGMASFGTTWTVTNSGFVFSPVTITIMVGDSVNFSIASIHNAVEVNQATWDANGVTPLLGGFSTPLGGGLILPDKLTVGTHYYVCTVHVGTMGMKGTIIVQNPTEIKENSLLKDIVIYPNPSQGQINVTANNNQPFENYCAVEVYNSLGNKVYSTSELKSRNSTLIDLSGYKKGIYFIRIYSDSEFIDKKIIIQ